MIAWKRLNTLLSKGRTPMYALVNMNFETQIRYGVIHQNKVLEARCEESIPYYSPDIEDDDFAEPTSFIIQNKKYKAESDNYGDIFITESSYYTLCGLCSPCAPNAGDLTSKGNLKAYCFSHDFFPEGKAPYKVYSVKTNKEVKP